MIELTKLEPAEKLRVYTYPSGIVTLTDVTHFLSRESGTHRLRTGDGKLHIMAPGWIHIEIEATGFTV